MKKYGMWVREKWRPLAAGLAMLVLMMGILTFRLGSLNHGATLSEINYLHSIKSGKKLLADPTFLIHKLPTYILFKLGFHNIAIYRLVSVVITAIAVTCGFIILKKAYSRRVAILGSTLLLASAWILHVGRSATPEATLLLIMPLLLIAVWLHYTTRHYVSLPVFAAVLVICFYIPGFWWLIAALIVWEHRVIWEVIKSVPWWLQTGCAVMIIAGLMPSCLAILHNPDILLLASGLPSHVSGLQPVGKNLLHIPQYLLVKGPVDPSHWLGRLPILDIFSTAMLILGMYSMRHHLKQHVVRLLAGGSLLVILLIAAGGLTTITALIPLVYVFIGAGIAFMLQQWQTVFPRNPVAHYLATTLLSTVILLAAYFHLSHYFIAWPKTPATKHTFQVFSAKIKTQRGDLKYEQV